MTTNQTPLTRRNALEKLGKLGGLALLLGRVELAFGATIVAVRVWPARDYTRVTIESDTPLQASHVLAESPPRLGVDISGLELNPALRELVGKVRADDPYIAGVRVGQYQPRVVRLVFDLKQTVRPEQFTLQPVAAYRHRLVFDLFPVKEADPLLALVRDKGSAEQRAAQSVQDALGELIARIDKPLQPPSPGASAAVLQSSATALPPTVAASGPFAAASAAATGPAAVAAQRAQLPSAAGPASAATTTAVPTPNPASPATASERQQVGRLIIVALDPGHGGEDPGAVGPPACAKKTWCWTSH